MAHRKEKCRTELITVMESATSGRGWYSCVSSGDKLNCAQDNVYRGDETHTNVTAIKTPDKHYYADIIPAGETIEYAACTAEADMLIEVLPRDNATILRITPHISNHLTPGKVDDVYGVVAYSFDYSESKEFSLPSSALFSYIFSGVMSGDGRYVYIDMAPRVTYGNGDEGFGRIVTHKIDTVKWTIESFTLPDQATGNQIVAVSPSGRYVVSGRSVVDTSDCHYDNTIDSRVCRSRSYADELDSIAKDGSRQSESGEYYLSVYFSEGETSITLETVTEMWGPSGKFYRISIVPPLDYLALGDSYSSGEGDIGKKANGSSYYVRGTDGNEECHLSSRSYPFLLGAKLGYGDSMQSVACSGAEVYGDYYGDGRYNGQYNQFVDKSESGLAAERIETLQDFTPGEIRQIEFVKEYRPKTVTFTGGGNDVGFASILEYCASSYRILGRVPINETCAFVYDAQLRASLNSAIDTQYVFNKKFVEEIRNASPETEIYLVGYPQFIEGDGYSCFRSSAILNNDEIKFIRESVVRLNNILKRVARDTGIYYIDTEDSLDGGQICQGSKYMTGPVRTIVKNGSVIKDDNMYHPNAAGHVKLAEQIAKQIKEKPGYDIIDIPAEEDATRVVRTAVLPDYAGVGSTQLVTMKPGIIKADGTSSIDIFSNKVHIGDYKTDASGALNVEITIPKEVGIGYHLLTIDGLDADDQPVQVQQFVYVIGDNLDDIDGDGIPNEHDPCFVVTEWYVGDVNECVPTGLGDAKSAVVVEVGISQNSSKKVSSDGADWTVATTSSADGSMPLLGDKPTVAQSAPRRIAREVGANSRQTTLWLIMLFGTIILLGILYARIRSSPKSKSKKV